MAYQKQTWNNNPSGGTPITAERLNHMEEGIANAVETDSVASLNVLEINNSIKTISPTNAGLTGLKWLYIGDFSFGAQGQCVYLDCFTSNGQNGTPDQQIIYKINILQGWTGMDLPIGVVVNFEQNFNSDVKVKIKHITKSKVALYVYIHSAYPSFAYEVHGDFLSFDKKNIILDSEPESDKEAAYFHYPSIYTTTVSAVTDENGFIDNTSIPFSKNIISCKLINRDGICLPYTHLNGTFSFKCVNWNLENFGQQECTAYVIYTD